MEAITGWRLKIIQFACQIHVLKPAKRSLY